MEQEALRENDLEKYFQGKNHVSGILNRKRTVWSVPSPTASPQKSCSERCQREVAMPKQKRILTSAQRAAKRRRKAETMIVFINGKQKRVRREPTVEGLPVDEFLRRNADPIWLAQAGEWGVIEAREQP
jgi:hypothetical protein